MMQIQITFLVPIKFSSPSNVNNCFINSFYDKSIHFSQYSPPPLPPDCLDGNVRLVGGTTMLEGRVELCYDGVWGTICNFGWNAQDSAVVCRQLGYSSSGK